MDIPSPASSNDTLGQTPPSLLFATSTSGRSAPGAGLHRSATQPIPATSHPIGGSLGRAQTQRSQNLWNQPPQSRSQVYNLSGSAHSSGTFPSSSSTFVSSALERSLSNNANYHPTSVSPSSSSAFLNTSSSLHLSTSSKSLATIEVRGMSRDFDTTSTISTISSDRNQYSQINSSPLPGATSFGRDRENSIGGEDVWANLCVKVLPLFNGEGVKGALEDLNDLLRHCLTDPISPTLYSDIESLFRDGMLTLNGKLYGVSDDKLVSRLVEQWSFFFGNVLPYIEGVFLPLRTDVRWRNIEEEDFWNVRTIALKNFRDCVILPMIERLEEVFAKLFIDFDSDKNPAETAARMLQMTSILASIPNDRNSDIERVSDKLKANCKKFMNRRDRRGFVGIQELRKPTAKPGRIFSPIP